LSETVIPQPLDEAIAQGELTGSETHWQITQHGKLFLNLLPVLFLTE
jgi:coproporphyrinogen III oxidase, anaerobic (EC 1.3.99.22)